MENTRIFSINVIERGLRANDRNISKLPGGRAMEKTQSALDREKVLQIIRLHKETFAKRYGVTKIGIFGSVAKGRTGPGSDVDVVVEMSRPDLFYLVHIKNELEEALGNDVDILHYRKNMNRFLQKRIQQEAIYV